MPKHNKTMSHSQALRIRWHNGRRLTRKKPLVYPPLLNDGSDVAGCKKLSKK